MPTEQTQEASREELFKLLDGFESKISRAQFDGVDHIETAQPVIDYFNKKGLNGAKYFIYKGIKIFPVGTAAKIMEEEQTPLSVTLHGAMEGKIEGRTSG